MLSAQTNVEREEKSLFVSMSFEHKVFDFWFHYSLFCLWLRTLDCFLPLYNAFQGIDIVYRVFAIQFRRELTHEWILEDHRGILHQFMYNMDLLKPRITNGWSDNFEKCKIRKENVPNI